MTFAIGHVSGGTNAGRKRPLKPAPPAWVHVCNGGTWEAPRDGGRALPGYMTRCPDCPAKRP
jgi:hypothetical protein